MANVIKPKRSGTAGKVPTTTDLADGELAVNSTDKKIYLRVGAAIVELAPTGGTTWGNIGGTLASQTDLQNALNAKANSSAPSFTTSVDLKHMPGTGAGTWFDGETLTRRSFVGMESNTNTLWRVYSVSANVNVLTLDLPTGALNIAGPITQAGQQVWHAGNFDPATKLSTFYQTRHYIPDLRPTVPAPSGHNGKFAEWQFNDKALTGAGGDAYHAVLTVSPWTDWNAAHRQQQLAFTGTGGLYFRYATAATTWDTWQQVWTDRNQLGLGTTAATARTALGLANSATIPAAMTNAANQIAQRDAAGDIQVRLLRSEFGSQTTIPDNAGLAYRNASGVGADNYVRFCTDPGAVRAWLGAGLGNVADMISDWNSAISNGWFMGSGALNGPTTGWNIGLVTVHNGAWITQEVWDFTAGSSPYRYRRAMLNGTWSVWTKDQNFGRTNHDQAIFVRENQEPWSPPAGRVFGHYYNNAMRNGGTTFCYDYAGTGYQPITVESSSWTFLINGGTGNGYTVLNSSGLTTTGSIEANGPSGQLVFRDRTTARGWLWYATGDVAHLYNGSGNIVSVSTGGAVTAAGGFQQGSARALKNIEGPNPYGLEHINRLQTYVGTYKEEYNPDGRRRMFVIADEVKKVLPEVVVEGAIEHADSKHAAVDYASLVVPLIRAVQELTARVAELERSR